MMPEDAPRPGTACIVIDCERWATLHVQVTDTASLDEQPNSIAMCDEHATRWRDGDLG
jgi:hypothetical protein